MSFKCFLAVGVKHGYRIRHGDVVMAFLCRFLDGIMNIKQPYLFVTELNKVCKLIKALNRLKQAPYIWYKTLVEFLKKLRFIRLELDHGILMSTDKQLYISVHFDRFFFFGTDVARLEDLQQRLRDQFKMTD